MSNREPRLSTVSYRKKSRRNTEDRSKSLEFGIDDCTRFPTLLQKACEERAYLFIPVIKTYQIREDGLTLQVYTPKPYNFEVLEEIVLRLYLNTEMKLKMIHCVTDQILDSRLFYSLTMILQMFSPLLTTVKLDYCNLKATEIIILQESLNAKKTITELSISGNPNEKQNFFCLVHCGLKVLNLKFCQINIKGLEKISNEYLDAPPHCSSLIHLDLSHNMIFDDGCKYIANILRCDRNLLSINLTDCKIGDEGLQTLLPSFLEFSLHTDELYFRRKIRMELYKLTFSTKHSSSDSSNSILLAEADMKDKLATIEALSSKHPFLIDAYESNGNIMCKGNYTLKHLNISYNPMTKESLNILVKTLMEQTLLFGHEKGLTRIVFDGISPNNHECEDVKNTITDLLVTKRMRISSSSSNPVTAAQNRSSLRRSLKKTLSGASTNRSSQLSTKDREGL